MTEVAENIYWELSDGTIWKLRPVGSGMYHIFNETANCMVAQFQALDTARNLVSLANLTIKEEC